MKPFADLTEDEFAQCLRRAAALPVVPPPWTHAAVRLWSARAASPLQSAMRRVAAVLAADSWSRGAVAAGLRARRSDTRQLLFNADGRDIDLRITPTGDRFALTGQVLGAFVAGEVELAWHVQPSAMPSVVRGEPVRTALDELGEFRLEAIGCGVYELRLRLGGDEIVLPPVDVGSTAR